MQTMESAYYLGIDAVQTSHRDHRMKANEYQACFLFDLGRPCSGTSIFQVEAEEVEKEAAQISNVVRVFV